jgi:ABC-2 type transport system permease protein
MDRFLPLLGIAFGFDAINNERAERTLPRLLPQPIWRDDYQRQSLGADGDRVSLAAIVVVIAGRSSGWGRAQA